MKVLIILFVLLILHLIWIEMRKKRRFDNSWKYPENYEDINKKLHQNGFMVIRGCVKPETIEQFRESVGKKDVNYKGISPVVYDVKECLRELFGWESIMTKYRVSNQENKIDASFLHNDLKNVSRTNTPIPCHTVLLYGDKGRMQLIPKSHHKTHISIIQAAYDLKNVITVDIEPGDLLIFNASLIHRGIFFNTNDNRRLIQFFEVYPNKETFEKFATMVDTSYVNKSPVIKLLQDINRSTSTQPAINELTNILMYFNYRLGNQPQLNKVPDKYNSMFASNETKKRLVSMDDTTMNIYVPITDACPEINKNIRKCYR